MGRLCLITRLVLLTSGRLIEHTSTAVLRRVVRIPLPTRPRVSCVSILIQVVTILLDQIKVMVDVQNALDQTQRPLIL